MTLPRLDPVQTGTVDQAGAYLQTQFHALGMERNITPDEFTFAEQMVQRQFPSFDGATVTGAMVNYVLDLMEPYVGTMLAERPFADAPQNQSGWPYRYDAVLPWTPPQSRDFLRADLWGTRVPEAPIIYRGSSRYPESVLTYLIHDYDSHWREQTYTAHHNRQHTHFYLSWPDARDAAGFSVARFVELAREVKSAGFYVGVMLGAKGRLQGNDIDGDPFCQTAAQWITRVQPVLDELLSAQVIDEAVPAWEMDLFNTPGGPTIEYCRWVGQRMHSGGGTCWYHGSTGNGAWYQDGDSRHRFGFWDDLGNAMDGLNYQAASSWGPDLLQGHLMDWLLQFEQQGNRHKVRGFELKASEQFDQESVAAERKGNIASYIACCTGGKYSGFTSARVWGSGNGPARPDGSAF